MPIKREEGAGFELQKKPAHYSKGSCNVLQGTRPHCKRKKKKEKAFKPSPASIKAITLLHGTFIVPLQLRQQLFSGAGLKTRPEPVLCCSSTSRQDFSTPSSMHRHAQPVAVTPKFISPFNWISWRRARRRGGMARAVGVPGAWWDNDSAEKDRVGTGLLWQGPALCRTHQTWCGLGALLAG